jgi:subtilase family serine protease
MKMRVLAAVAVAIPLAFGTSRLVAQGNSDDASIHVPDSSIEKPGDEGKKAHTNHVVALRGTKPRGGSGPDGGMAPSDIRAAYNLPDAGGSGIIAIIDAYDYPTALSDFNTFSGQFNLPPEPSTDAFSSSNKVFQVVYANGAQPSGDCGWDQESALDIEWAHAMAPNAKIVLVLANSSSFSDLFNAVNYAEGLGASQISMSWGGSEFFFESSYDSTFNGNLTYFAASGDTGGKTIYPGVSPKVVAAGGTSLKLVNGAWTETGWSGSGGGGSRYEKRPSFQNVISSKVGTKRGVPDFSFDADPNTGVSVFDSTSCQGYVDWMVFGGTSVASPSLAGIVNNAAHNNGSNELTTVYSGLPTAYSSKNFRDITSGNAGSNRAGTGWDFVTGIGSSLGLQGK